MIRQSQPDVNGDLWVSTLLLVCLALDD